MTLSLILGVPFHAMGEGEALDVLEGYLGEERNHVIVTPNPEAVMQTNRNEAFRDAIMNADLRLADGAGIVLASRLLGAPIPRRLRGYDTILALFDRLSQQGRPFSAYFLGGAAGVAEAAGNNMTKQYPLLHVVGCHHGYFNAQDETLIIDEIKKSQPDFLLVCLGMPRQEIWAAAHRTLPVRLTFCLGGSLDIMGGTVKLAPAALRKLGLEWLYRLITQPSRAKRMLDLPRFAWAVIRKKMGR